MSPEMARLALPSSTDPVKPGDAVGSGVPVAPVAPVTPVAPVAPVAAGEVEGDTLPVGDASGGGPSDPGSFPPHAISTRHAADTTMRLERTRAPFGRLTVTQRRGQLRWAPASTDGVVA
jgi:hypothetical protein